MPGAIDAVRGPHQHVSRRERLADFLGSWALPLGLLVLLTGLFWVWDRSDYHRLFYLLMAFPAGLALFARPALLDDLVRSPVCVPFLAFSAYILLSIAWSDTDAPALSLIKRPFYLALLFVGVMAVARMKPERLEQVLSAAVIGSVLAGLIALFRWKTLNEPRLTGYATLYNPLLTSHVFGFFLALCVAAWIQCRRLFPPVIAVATLVLATVIIATGSRTPLVGIAATVIWLMALTRDKRAIVAAIVLASAGAIAYALLPELLTNRGLSYRPEIWSEAWRQILRAPMLGHGYDATLEIFVEGIPYAFLEPHNMVLAVLYFGGFAGLALWTWLYGSTLVACWRQRADSLVFICSAPLVYGLAASMTEGGSFLPRPKEHWFLIWIPFALLAAALRNPRGDR